MRWPVALVLATIALIGPSAPADPNPLCSPAAIDPFGSCELTSHFDGVTRCGTGTHIDARGTIVRPNVGEGVQFCADRSNSTLPAWGRTGIYRDPSGVVTIFYDGDDVKNEAGVASWLRVDLRPDAAACKAQTRHGSGGSYWNTQAGTSSALVDNVGQYSGSSRPDLVNACA